MAHLWVEHVCPAEGQVVGPPDCPLGHQHGPDNLATGEEMTLAGKRDGEPKKHWDRDPPPSQPGIGVPVAGCKITTRRSNIHMMARRAWTSRYLLMPENGPTRGQWHAPKEM